MVDVDPARRCAGGSLRQRLRALRSGGRHDTERRQDTGQKRSSIEVGHGFGEYYIGRRLSRLAGGIPARGPVKLMCKNGRQPSTRLRLATTRAPADVHEAIQVRPVVALTVWLWLSADIVQAQARHEHVFSIEAHDCRGRDLRQTGFRTLVDGVVGIVTTLHGVVGCGSVEAENGRDRLRGLGITRVDVSRDAAFLSSDSMQGEGMLRAASDPAPMTDVEAVGPGASVALQPRRTLTFRVGHAVRVAGIVWGHRGRSPGAAQP